MRGSSRPALDAHEKRPVAVERVRALFEIGLDGCLRDGQHGRQPFLAALARDAEHVTRGKRRVLAVKAERFGDPQARAIEQQQHGLIARPGPGMIAQLAVERGLADHILRLDP